MDAKRPRHRTERRPRGPGFTLVELLIVIAVIGIILALILTAAMEGIRRGEERQTQALISKLESALSDRFDAVYSTQADANNAHGYLGLVFNSTFGSPPASTVPKLGPPLGGPPFYPELNQRAQVIAKMDYLKAELPDVFVVQPDPRYPFNFAFPATGFPGNPVPNSMGAPGLMPSYAHALLPLGVAILNDPSKSVGPQSFGDGAIVPTASGIFAQPETTGAFGGSYTAMGGLTKGLNDSAVRLGLAAAPTPATAGYDGIDNDGNGLIDDIDENGPAMKAAILTLLSRHQHATARSEMLYALLVNGQGPYGSVFTPDDFTDSEVKDTDGDGMLEFVDAWGQPLQFYRWPIGFPSDVQQGFRAYNNAFDTREQNPADPSQSLMDPTWWANTPAIAGTVANDVSPFMATSGLMSGSSLFFQSMFFPLSDPNYPAISSGGAGAVWDRGPAKYGGSPNPANARRAFYSKFLVLSGGPDQVPGVPVMDLTVFNKLTSFAPAAFPPTPMRWFTGAGASATIDDLLIENQAAPVWPIRNHPYYDFGSGYPGADAVSAALQLAGQDDITSHNLLSPGGAAQ